MHRKAIYERKINFLKSDRQPVTLKPVKVQQVSLSLVELMKSGKKSVTYNDDDIKAPEPIINNAPITEPDPKTPTPTPTPTAPAPK